ETAVCPHPQFEGTKDAEDIRRFWQNFLHPSINKNRWSPEEVQHLKEVSRSWTPSEDALLRELVEKMRIGNFIPYTQSNDITLTWNQVLDPSLKRGPWTKEEDQGVWVRNMSGTCPCVCVQVP
uniref:Uncharacterized protein n=1 Tax=Acanthochromis polyacanthus TaxID=80966 RepID=A0A3Q1EKT9_9TELE